MFLPLSLAAARAGYSAITLKRWIEQGRLPAYRASARGHYRVKVADLDALLRKVEIEPKEIQIQSKAEMDALVDAVFAQNGILPKRRRSAQPVVLMH